MKVARASCSARMAGESPNRGVAYGFSEEKLIAVSPGGINPQTNLCLFGRRVNLRPVAIERGICLTSRQLGPQNLVRLILWDSPMALASLTTRKKRARQVVEGLKREYPDAECALVHDTPFELLIATILSAQCTDER